MPKVNMELQIETEMAIMEERFHKLGQEGGWEDSQLDLHLRHLHVPQEADEVKLNPGFHFR